MERRLSILALVLASGSLVAAHVSADRAALALPDPGDDEESGCDPGAGGEVDARELIEDEAPDRTIETPMPTVWRESASRQCQRHGGRRVCDGPRRVPEPMGPAAELARSLGIEEARAGHVGMTGDPPEAWVEAVDGEVGPGLLWPVPEGRLWRGWGTQRRIIRRGNGRLARSRRTRQHQGVDIGAPEGSAIRAVNDGLVIYSFNGMRGYGNSVLLLHADRTVSLYAHCRATYVFAGQRVARGQVIAEVGATGLAHGAHLHFEWRRSGRSLDPLAHFVDRPDGEVEVEAHEHPEDEP
jgi:murein DD-endopeptidase MepM/ murein hydrolase activator NlpD